MGEQVQFSGRESEVIALLLEGKSNKQIAFSLGVSVRTVEFHLSKIYAKLGVNSRTEAAVKLTELSLRESTGGDVRESTWGEIGVYADNGGNFVPRRFLMKKTLIVIGGIGLGIALIVTLFSVFLVLNAPVKGEPFGYIATVDVLVETPSTLGMSPTVSSKEPLNSFETTTPIIPPQPTPQDTLGGGTVFDGPFVFDLRLFRDSSFNQHPVATSLYSDLDGIGAWMYWFYTGADIIGSVETYWGTLPQLDQLLQETYDSIQLGTSGGRTGGVGLPGGLLIPGNSKPGDRVQVALKVVTPDGEYGAVLAFTLKQGVNGFEPTDISVNIP